MFCFFSRRSDDRMQEQALKSPEEHQQQQQFSFRHRQAPRKREQKQTRRKRRARPPRGENRTERERERERKKGKLTGGLKHMKQHKQGGAMQQSGLPRNSLTGDSVTNRG